MKTIIILIILTFSINSYSQFATGSDLHIQIRDEVAAAKTEKGQSFFQSYLYALISGSSVRTDLYFSGNANEVIDVIGDLFLNGDSNYYEIAAISYRGESDQIAMILIDNLCASEYVREDCLFDISITRIK